jgi:hypothetical protein
LNKNKKSLESKKYLREADAKRIGNVILEQIRDRTRSGLGVDENGKEYSLSSTPYSEKYAKQKGVSRSKVDLTLSGDMLENLFVKNADKEKIELSVRNRDYGKLRGAEEGIIRNKATGGKKGKTLKEIIKRPFFHLSKNDIEKIKNSDDFQGTLERINKRMEEEHNKER